MVKSRRAHIFLLCSFPGSLSNIIFKIDNILSNFFHNLQSSFLILCCHLPSYIVLSSKAMILNFGYTLGSRGNFQNYECLGCTPIKSELLDWGPVVSIFKSSPTDSNVQVRWRNCSDGLLHLLLSALFRALFTFSIFQSVHLLRPVWAHACSRTLFIIFLKFPSHLFKPNPLFLQTSPPQSLCWSPFQTAPFYIISLLLKVLHLIVYFLELLLNCISFIHVTSATEF